MSPSGFSVDFDDPALEARVRGGLRAVEVALADAVKSDDEFVADAARYLSDAGGKRVRPLLSLLAAEFGDPSAPEIVQGAVVVELTHLATLYHDDVMDEATVRRGAAAANARWNNTVAILTGDFLFSRASDLLADLGTHAVRVQARTFSRLVTGQIRETVGPRAGVDPTEHYLAVLADKTGSLLAAAAEFGAYFAGADAGVIDLVRQFAELYGVAFQISDDILDIASQAVDSGKTPGTDLREGILTLPMLYALRPDSGDDPRLRTLLTQPLDDDADFAEALGLLRASRGLAEARATATQYTTSARAVLVDLPDIPARHALEALTDAVVDRTG